MDGIRANPLSNVNDITLQDFLVDPNFDQFINLIRGDQTPAGDDNPVPGGFDLDNLVNSSCFTDRTQFCPTEDNLFINNLPDLDSNIADSFPSFDDESMIKACNDDEEDYNDGEEDEYSATAATTNMGRNNKVKPDRSRTLISERRRRGRMKEKLYALRALVPNITKMDKASIIGDAVSYVQELQMQAKKLKAEIAGLEASLQCAERYHDSFSHTRKTQNIGRSDNFSTCKKIFQMDVVQVEEKGFYVRLVSNKGQGVAPSLYKSLESLTSFHVHNTNLTTSADKYLLSFTLDGTDFGQTLNLRNLKLWITGSLLNQGFEFVPPLTSPS